MSLLTRLADRLDPPPDPLRDDPARWVAKRTGEVTWSKQVEIIEAVRDHRRVAVKASHGIGKSWIAGRAVVHWIDTHPVGQAFAVTTAPTDSQVKAILWREIRGAFRKLQARAKRLLPGGRRPKPAPGRVLDSPEWKVDGQLVAYGRKPADHDPDGFQGIHDRYVLVVLDEACGIPKMLWTAAGSLTTNEDGRILAIGNPDHPDSEFAEVCRGAPEDGSSGLSDRGWWVITVSTFDTPNFTGETVPAELRHMLPSKTWLEEKRLEWGEDSPLWSSKVLGRFPADSKDGTIPWSWLKRCQGDESLRRVGELRVPVELGVDVAGSEEGDETVIRARCGMVAGGVWRVRTTDSEKIVDAVISAVREVEATSVKVDSIGVGFGVLGSLRRRVVREVGHQVEVHGVAVSDAALEPAKYVNLRAWLWWEIGREYARTGAFDLTGVDDDTLNQLAAPKYFEKNGRIQIESKDEVRKRLKRSTDDADALLLAFYMPKPATPPVTGGQYENRARRSSR